MNAFSLRLEIAKTFHDTKIYPVPGDGHCLICSWENALMDSEKVQFEPSYDALRNLINMEFQRNINEYTSFLVSRSPYEEVEKYLNEKSYSHEIGDIIINILANVTSTSAYIYEGGEGNEYIQSNFIAPRSRAINGEMQLFKRGEHYDPIVNRNFEKTGVVKNKGLSLKFFSQKNGCDDINSSTEQCYKKKVLTVIILPQLLPYR